MTERGKNLLLLAVTVCVTLLACEIAARRLQPQGDELAWLEQLLHPSVRNFNALLRSKTGRKSLRPF